MTDEEKGLSILQLSRTTVWREIIVPWFMQTREYATIDLENKPKTLEDAWYLNGRIHVIREFFDYTQNIISQYMEKEKTKKEEAVTNK